MLILFFNILFIICCITVFLRWFERLHIFFPTKQIVYTPKDIDLEYEDVYFKTQDNKTLNGWYVPAKDAKATILYSHGNGGNISHRIDIIKIFNRMKLNVFIFDYRGYGRSRGLASERGTYLDARAAYDYVASRKDMDKQKIIGYGESLGGVVIIDLATQADLRAIITEGTFTSTMDMATRLFPILPIKFIITMKYDALSKIKTLTMPKLIIHSIDDEIVPFNHAERLYEAAPEPKGLFKMRGGHNEALFIESNNFQGKIKEFIEEIL